jgi:triacylglycerol esterase/lipase EstA (alpha/beta hydrolase family)
MGHVRRGAALSVVVPIVFMALLMPSPAAAAPPDDPTLPGANQWTSCRPSPEHPRPAVLVHGNGSGMTATWRALSMRLSRSGFCVFALDYGRHQPGSTDNVLDIAGGDDIESSAKALAAFVDRVRSITGAQQVDVVSHSMGALTARQFLKFGGGAVPANPALNAVHTLVSVGGTNHGSTFESNAELLHQARSAGLPADELLATTVGPAYVQQMVGSRFLTRLNSGGDTEPGVTYLAVATRDDKVVTPPENALLTAGPDASVDNVWVQDGCPGMTVDHMGLTTNPRALWIIESGLDPDYADQHPAPCS